MKQTKLFYEILKYSIVGIINTLITLASIWILTKWFDVSNYIANPIGYVLGVVNSFIGNKIWTFGNRNHSKLVVTGLSFILIFAISYCIQYGILILLLYLYPNFGFINQIISMIVFSFVNFILNKHITFKKDSENGKNA